MPADLTQPNSASWNQQVINEPVNSNINTPNELLGLQKQANDDAQVVSIQQLPPVVSPQQERSFPVPTHPSYKKRPTTRYIKLIASLIIVLLAISTIMHLILIGKIAPQAMLVGQVAFTNSEQLDLTSSKGLNDRVTVNLYNVSVPATGKSLFAWLLPDQFDDNTPPLLLSKLTIVGGKIQFTDSDPNHQNLLLSYSGFGVTEQPSDQVPTTPPLDLRAWYCLGRIPNIPNPDDKKQYSLLDHTRHLLAKDPNLQPIGLDGGLGIWLYRNTEKILELSSAARDSWTGGLQTDLIHSQMIRILDYLDGAAYVSTSGDIPPNSPLLINPQTGRIGLLEMSQTQTLPAYLSHVDLHLQGIIKAPGHTQEQSQLADKIDTALKQITSLMQKIRQDAITLAKMKETQLQSQDAQTLLNDMVTNANGAYAGQFDPATGETINGVVWIHNELQGFAIIPITTITSNNQL